MTKAGPQGRTASAMALARPGAVASPPARCPLSQRACACGRTPDPGGECEQCRRNRLGLQRKAATPSAPATAPAVVHDVLRSTGRPLDPDTRTFMESRFGHDFGRVRVHTDARAAESAGAVNALAYTAGGHMVFAAGRYAPGTAEGRELLAHELAHVVQQGAGQTAAAAPAAAAATTGPMTIGSPADPAEKEAEAAARSVAAGGPVPARALTSGVTPQAGPVLRRVCPADWRTTVRGGGGDHDRALEMIAVAQRKLSAYDGTSPAEVHAALATHFHSTSAAFAGWVNFNLGYLRHMARLADYTCSPQGSWQCGPSTLAWAFWCVPFVDIRVCAPLYFSKPAVERSTTLIHEWVHKYGCNFDLGYRGSEEYSGSGTLTSLLNADPFAEFVRDVQ